MALFQNFLLSLDICWAFSVGQDGHTSRFNLLVAFRRPNIGREHSLAFFIEFDTYLTTVILTKILELVYVKYICSKIDYFENCCHLCPSFVQKAGLILATRWLFTSIIKYTNVIIGLTFSGLLNFELRVVSDELRVVSYEL